MNPIRIAARLAEEVRTLRFGVPVTHIYNPLDYARRPHESYLRRFAGQGREVILIGMNPGPWGMAQTGVPFGDVALVRDWLGIQAPVEKPDPEHPKRPVLGFACPRSEVSGTRLWGWARQRFKTPERFFDRFFVYNYCPLCFMEESGRNFTPDKLSAREKTRLFEACDRALQRLVETMNPHYLIGVGAFAEKRIRGALPHFDGQVGRILHPSPANPLANSGWAEAAEKDLAKCGVTL